MSEPKDVDIRAVMSLYSYSFNGITDTIAALEKVVATLKQLQNTTEEVFVELGIDLHCSE